MARAECPHGKPYATKKACEDATGKPAKRCERCRGYHPATKRTKGGKPR